MKKRWGTAIALGVLCAWTCLSAAEEPSRWYQVEVLVFAHLDPALTASEAWPADPGRPDALEAVLLAEPGATPPWNHAHRGGGYGTAPTPTAEATAGTGPVTGFDALEPPYVRLAEEELGLHEIAERLAAHPRYRPLMLRGWRQPVSSRMVARPVVLRSDPEEALLVPLEAYPLATAILEPPPSLSRGFNGVDEWLPLEGTVRAWAGRYLHLDIDLVYRRLAEVVSITPPMVTPETPNPSTAASATDGSPATDRREVLQQFRMQQTRRLRSDQLHYFDHPAFGALARLIPYPASQSQAAPPVHTRLPRAAALAAPTGARPPAPATVAVAIRLGAEGDDQSR